MTLLFVDSFDHYATADFTEKGYVVTQTPAITAAVGRRGTSALEIVNTFAENIAIGFSSVASVVFGFAFYPDAVPSAAVGIASVLDTGTVHLTLCLNADLTLSIMRGASSGTVLGTSSSALVQDAWTYVEFKCTINDSTGAYELRFNGANVASGSSVDTRNGANATCNTVKLGTDTSASSNLKYDDFYICDTAGSVNNDFLGDVRVDAYVPDGAGTTTQFTPLSGSNYANVDDATPDDDTTYVESSTVGHIDLYAITNISHTPSTIHGVQVCMNAKKDDAGAREIKEKCRSASTNYSGTAQALSTDYKFYREIRETDPGTSAAWSKANLNSAEFGIEVAS